MKIDGVTRFMRPGGPGLVDVTFDDGRTNPAAIAAILAKEGFPVQGAPVPLQQNRRSLPPPATRSGD